jgi:hypothetical protein
MELADMADTLFLYSLLFWYPAGKEFAAIHD